MQRAGNIEFAVSESVGTYSCCLPFSSPPKEISTFSAVGCQQVSLNNIDCESVHSTLL